ncbi:hypothetical protein Goari_000824 [Gossypium aridum]|uniref:Uncharacterized protein n=1 Tax=Gossypium aridum TaxID=34290 RepID=A0A7J8YHT7_GOSAI|nr:hypothetical protein [Gossypium aridum]
MSSNRANSDEVESNAQASIQGATSLEQVRVNKPPVDKIRKYGAEEFHGIAGDDIEKAKFWLENTEVRDTNVSKVSYKTKLLGTSSNQNPNANMEEPFELQDEVIAIEPWEYISTYRFGELVYLVRFQENNDFNKVLIGEGFYSNFLLRAISQVIDTVVKIDAHTTAAVKGRFANMAVCVDLNKPLASKKGRWKGSLEIKIGGVNCVDGLHFLVLEIDGTKTNTARRAVMEWIFDGDVNEEGITVKIIGKKERKVVVDKSNSKFNSARAKGK